ncbi:hypothetical protein [Pollutimonas sp. M17]|uniref:hypothetical protein n=1 Tax=Pollutimonas sp. M17 TaxID=2962065 RepID=UPI0021F3D754|nr:hypothetical protein [Pollutimonas sp. M17]UYO94699.1 hypothetical protein OEG81_05090 [Pollutimonas sp. M17]
MDLYQAKALGVYVDGPFEGRQRVHPYHTVLSRLARMGINPHVRQMGESERAYVERMNRDYSGIFSDVLSEGILNDDG